MINCPARDSIRPNSHIPPSGLTSLVQIFSNIPGKKCAAVCCKIIDFDKNKETAQRTSCCSSLSLQRMRYTVCTDLKHGLLPANLFAIPTIPYIMRIKFSEK
jgi:hypothetical protein